MACQGTGCPDKRAGDLIAGFGELRGIGTQGGTGRGQDGGDDFILLPRPSPRFQTFYPRVCCGIESNLGHLGIAHHLVVQGGALVGKLLAVEPLGYEVDTPAGLFLARGGPLSPALSELLINLGTTTATAALRFPPLRGLE